MTNCQNHFLAPNVKVQTRPKEMLALSPWVASFPEKIKAYLNEKYLNGEETGNKAHRDCLLVGAGCLSSQLQQIAAYFSRLAAIKKKHGGPAFLSWE